MGALIYIYIYIYILSDIAYSVYFTPSHPIYNTPVSHKHHEYTPLTYCVERGGPVGVLCEDEGYGAFAVGTVGLWKKINCAIERNEDHTIALGKSCRSLSTTRCESTHWTVIPPPHIPVSTHHIPVSTHLIGV